MYPIKLRVIRTATIQPISSQDDMPTTKALRNETKSTWSGREGHIPETSNAKLPQQTTKLTTEVHARIRRIFGR
jgi:hypothetical protein